MTKTIGAIYTAGYGCMFTVWSPETTAMQLHIIHPFDRTIDMQKDTQGYFTARIEEAAPGCRYYFNADAKGDKPDPASFYQPEGVHGPSEVIDIHTPWTDNSWKPIALQDYIIYELHIGTFTPEGTFEAAISQLDDLAQTGINAIEIMPVAQFPGRRNWGYDGVFSYAAQNSYGGPHGLKKLVEACHARGIAVILDVVYNHLGPEGNYLPLFAPYFTDKYKTPWGDALNFDREWCDGVRNYFINNALYWMRYFHIDGLRLDAIHQMYDFGAVHFWEQLHYEVEYLSRELGRPFYLIAESDLNNPKVVKHPEAGGFGFNAQWLDDFHHSLYVLLDPAGAYRYKEFGSIEQVAKAYTSGFVHGGDFVPFRKKKFGRSSAGISGNHFIVFNQNHDQVGNTADGRRLSERISFPLLKVAAAAIMMSPYIPMLFMGEEYGETSIFTYFIDHGDKDLVQAVREGRKKEFEGETWDDDTADPAGEEAYEACKLNWNLRKDGWHQLLLQWNAGLINLRRQNDALRNFDKNSVSVSIINEFCYYIHRKSEDEATQLLIIINLGKNECRHTLLPEYHHWKKILDSAVYAHDMNEVPFPGITTEEIVIPPAAVAVYTSGNNDSSTKERL